MLRRRRLLFAWWRGHRSKSRATIALTAWSTDSMRAMQLAESSVGASFFWPMEAAGFGGWEVTWVPGIAAPWHQ